MPIENSTSPAGPIVIVNDDPVQGALLRKIASSVAGNVILCEGVTDALKMLAETGPPALIITDLYMPDIDGWRFAHLLRSPEYGEYNTVPILVTSATYAGHDPHEISRQLSVSAFLPLPAQSDEVADMITRLLRGEVPRQVSRVLVVDDDPTTTLILKRYFSDNGYDVFTAPSGTEAVEAFTRDSFDGVLLDYHLEDMTGDSLLERFRCNAAGLVLVMMTADPDPELAVRWMQQGASAYVRKPIDPRYVLEVFERARRERSLMKIEEHLEMRTQEVRHLLEEQRLLTQEIHHRVKNNLAAVSALLGLRAGGVGNPTCIDVLLRAQQDVENVAMIYEQLFQVAAGHDVRLDEHLQRIVERIRRIQNQSVELTTNLPAITVDPNTAMRIGIIINELITNAYKYAFPDDRSGSVHLSGVVSGDDLSFRVVDDGVGVSPEVVDDTTDGFGLQMVQLLAEQLGGRVTVNTMESGGKPRGTEATVHVVVRDGDE